MDRRDIAPLHEGSSLMANGATKDYRFGQKNHWRRTIWNEVLRRTNGRERDEVILYLAGPQDLDRSIAVEKGVPVENLIAVDRCEENVQRIRSNKYAAICAEIQDVICAWPDNVTVCAVVLDFCSGLMSPDNLALISNATTLRTSLAKAVLALNFMRGRDPSSEVIRKECIRTVTINEELTRRGLQDTKHRGLAFSLWHAALFCNLAALKAGSDAIAVNLCWMNPKFFSYRSGSLVFDSVVISPISNSFEITDSDLWNKTVKEIIPIDQRTARLIAATLAVRTKRMSTRVRV